MRWSDKSFVGIIRIIAAVATVIALGVYSTSTAAQHRAREIDGLGYSVHSAVFGRMREFWVLSVTTVSGLPFDRQAFEGRFPAQVLLETSCD